MSTIRTEKRSTPFVQIDKTALEDECLSWKAKGLLAYLLSRPDDWQVYVRQLSTVSTDGKDATGTGLNELIDAGYVTRERQHDDGGRFDGYEYTVYETPELADSTVSGFSGNGLSGNGKTVDGKPATTNKDSTKKEATKKDQTKTAASAAREDLDFVPERHAYLKEEIRQNLDAFTSGSADPEMLARRLLKRGKQSYPKSVIASHVRDHPPEKFIAAWTIAASSAQSNPTKYANTILTENFRDTDTPKRRPEGSGNGGDGVGAGPDGRMGQWGEYA